MTPEVEERFKSAVKWLFEVRKVSVITGDCGFMMYFQKLARSLSHKPVCMSALNQLPSIAAAFSKGEQVIIMTANNVTLEPMHDQLVESCGVSFRDSTFPIIGCQDVPGFEAVALGEKVNTQMVSPGIVEAAKKAIKDNPNARAILLECTELPPYADAIREATGLPVFDAITNCNFYMSSLMDNPRFGKQNWQPKWDADQDDYCFGCNLTKEQ